MKSGYFAGTATSSSTSTSSSSSSSGTTRYLSTDVNLRSTPKVTSDNSNKIGAYEKGTKVTVLKSVSGGWYYVSVNGRKGYMKSGYFTTSSSSSTGTSKTVMDDGARLRSSRSTVGLSNVITTLDQGTKVTVLGTYGDWYKVKYGSKTGYMAKSLFT